MWLKLDDVVAAEARRRGSVADHLGVAGAAGVDPFDLLVALASLTEDPAPPPPADYGVETSWGTRRVTDRYTVRLRNGVEATVYRTVIRTYSQVRDGRRQP